MDALSGGCPNLDPTDTIGRIGTLFDFNADTLRMQAVDTFVESGMPIKYWTHGHVSQISNKYGQLTAYFNGIELWDRHGNYTALEVFKYFKPYEYNSIYPYNASVILPLPLHDDRYILIGANDYQYEPLPYGVPAAEAISAVHFDENSDGTLTIVKNVPRIFSGKLPYISPLTACRHANGRDWWVVAPKRFGRDMHTFIVDSSGISYHNTQTLSDIILDETYATDFSPDGKWYTRTNTEHISMYEKIIYGQLIPFDRCSGLFGDPVTFKLLYEDTSGISQIIFSKNSRYFYVSASASVWQGDIESDDVVQSLVRVCHFDASIKDHGYYLVFANSFLGPDGKIYIFDGNNNYRISVINHPDEAGLACDARYAAITKPSCTGASLGNMPDFNLGPIDGSPCDTLGLDNPLSVTPEIKKQSTPLDIWPNPTDGDFTVMVPSQGGKLDIYTTTGAKLLSQKVSDFQMEVSLTAPPGVYFAIYQSLDGKIRATGRVVVR